MAVNVTPSSLIIAGIMGCFWLFTVALLPCQVIAAWFLV